MKEIHIRIEGTSFPSPEAELEATKLTLGNIQFIKNRISVTYQELASLQLQQGKEAEYAQAVAYLRGQIAAYSDLINSHELSYLANPSE